jgi:hypothetical protein
MNGEFSDLLLAIISFIKSFQKQSLNSGDMISKMRTKKKNEKGEQTTNTPHIHFTITLRHLTHSLHFKKRLFSASATFQLHPDANFERFVFQINFQTGRWLFLLTMRNNCLVKP